MPTVSEMKAVMQSAGSLLRPYPACLEGRGVVIAGGGARYFPSVWVCINMLRRQGCTLPIELWHLGPEEVDGTMRALLHPLGVHVVDALEVRHDHPARILNGWELKPYAIIHSRFREVLLLDADNVPIVDPSYLFASAPYQQTGAVFWPDFGRLDPERQIWELACTAYNDEPEFETGQMLIDKERCWQALMLTMWMNEHSDFWYHHIHGDKDTFHISWRRLNQPYAMPSRGIDALDRVMCQHDFDGRRIFQHRNLAKWMLCGNDRIAGFAFEEECLAFLHDLRSRWPIAERLAGDLCRESRTLMDRLAGTRYRYTRLGHDSRTLLLGPDGCISDGAAECEAFWWIKGHELHIAAVSGGLTCTLRQGPDGAWEGRWLHSEEMPVRLEPAEISAQHGLHTNGASTGTSAMVHERTE